MWSQAYSFCSLAVGTMAFDVRIGLYDDPPNKDTVKMIQATFDVFEFAGKLTRGWESLLFTIVTTPSYRKFCEAHDTSFRISEKIVDNKVMELKKMAEEGGSFVEDQSGYNFINTANNNKKLYLDDHNCIPSVIKWTP